MPNSGREEAAQEELMRFLEDPASYPHHPGQVDILQTHISIVALASPYVYKVKKPVNLGFADFSTLEKRRYYCRREVQLNSRLCPHLYEEVVPIYRQGDALAFQESGEPVAYAVKMKELQGGCFLHEQLERGDIRRQDLERVIDRLKRFYRERSSPAEVAGWGRTARLKVSTDENFEQTKACVGSVISRPAFDAIRYYTDRFYDQHAVLINRRRAEGHIVDGHGDLRLEHVYLTPEAVCIYDCIEFSDRLRYVDVANDVAFLAMDLDYQGRPNLAQFFVHQMAASLDDPDMLRLIDFYKCYRAYVRGKVEHMRGTEQEVPPDEQEASRKRSACYFRWAAQYATAGSGPAVIAVMGSVGVGKSTQAQALSSALGWEAVSSDQVRKEEAGRALYERGTEADRARLYTEEKTQQTYEALRDRALARASKGKGTILDATYSKRKHREELRRELQREGIPHCFVELKAPEEAVKERLEQRTHATRKASDARLEDLETLNARYEAPDEREDAYHFTVEINGVTEQATLDVMKHVTRFELNTAP